MNEGSHKSNRDGARVTGGVLAALVPGQIIAGKFKVISLLGAGGMGTVYRVEQIFLNKEFALKTMDHRTGSDVMLQRFELEAKAAFSLNHPNLVKVHDYGILDNGNPYLVMDFINGITFADHLKKHGPVPVESVVPLFAQACFGLMAAHEQSVVHRDIKPANLMILNDVNLHTEGSVKLVDFGIAKLVNREDGEIQALTRTGEIFGSPLYMSPEQCSSGIVDHRSDIYSLGCVLFEMLTGTPPHMGPNTLKTMLLHQSGDIPTLKEGSLGKNFPESLERIVAKMLRRHPEQRYQNIGLVAQDLTRLGIENPSVNKNIPANVVKKPQKAQPKIVSMTPIRLYTLLAVTGAIAAILTGSVVYFTKSGRPVSADLSHSISKAAAAQPVEKDQLAATLADGKKVAAEMKERTMQLEQIPPIKETDVTINNQKKHQYFFPDINLGDVSYYDYKESNQYFHPARNVVTVPVDKTLGMRIDSPEALTMIQTPSIFKKIPGKDFQILILDVPDDYTPVFANTEELSPERFAKNVATALQNLDSWMNLTTLQIKGCPINQDAMSSINNFKKLHKFGLEHCTYDSQLLATQPFLSEISELTLCTDGKSDYDPIIKRLVKCPKLMALAINHMLTLESLHELKRSNSLQILNIFTKEIDDEHIAAICQLKNIRDLRLLDATLTDKQLQMLCDCPWLKEILLSRHKYAGRDEKVNALDHRIQFIGDDSLRKQVSETGTKPV